MSRILIVGNRSLGGAELGAIMAQRVAAGACETHLVVPVPSPVAAAVAVGAAAPDMAITLTRDVEDDRRLADEQLAHGLDWLRGMGVEATGGLAMESETPAAVAELVGRGGYDEVIVSTLPQKVSRWLRQDLPCRIGRKVAVPVIVVSNSPSAR